MKLRLWDQDPRSYRFYIETSTDKQNWELAVDRRNQDCKSWQHAEFSERITVFIKITGTHCSNANVRYVVCLHQCFTLYQFQYFHIITFECPSVLPSK